jgi:hypothetical protein
MRMIYVETFPVHGLNETESLGTAHTVPAPYDR